MRLRSATVATIAFLSFMFFGITISVAHHFSQYKPTAQGDGIIVELPKEISGEVLANLLLTEVTKIPVLTITDNSHATYRPGSVKKEISAYRFTITQPPRGYDRIFGLPQLPPELEIFFDPQEKYNHLVFKSVMISSTADRDFKRMEKNFETLLANIYRRLEHSQ